MTHGEIELFKYIITNSSPAALKASHIYFELNAIFKSRPSIFTITFSFTLPDSEFEDRSRPYPGVTLRIGSRGSDVTYLQEYLNTIASVYPEIPTISVDGIFGSATDEAVRAFQRLRGLNETGNVGAVTWEYIGETYDDIVLGLFRSDGQYPGYDIG